VSTSVNNGKRERPKQQPIVRPAALTHSPIKRLKREFLAEHRREGPYPPGLLKPSLGRTIGFAKDPLPILLDSYERFGPVFTLRIMSVPVVFMLGPEANHFALVSNADRFSWREGSMGDLTALLGDGLLTTDGPYHRRGRKIMLPAFHRDRIARSGELIVEEASAAVSQLSPGTNLDIYDWTRTLALRIAMRALFGFDPDDREHAAAEQFETALGYFGRDYFVQLLRGPRTPFGRLESSRKQLDRLIYSEISRRRSEGAAAAEQSGDLLGLLLATTSADGDSLSDEEIRDQVMTLLFAGHDTTTSTVTFMLYELSRNPEALAKVLNELDKKLAGRTPTPADLTGTELPELEMALDETLRLYPPAWIAPRRTVGSFECAGVSVPGGIQLSLSSWASHHLPDVWPDPEEFKPERFAPEAKASLAKGAYIPFGGGSRTCIGMRFGQMEVRAIVTLLLQQLRLDPVPNYDLQIRQMPTLSPKGGMEMRLSPR